MLFFIYGTLKKDGNNHSVLKSHMKKEKDSKAFGVPVETINKFPMYASSYGFPFLVDNKGIGSIIKGELWDIKEDNIGYMDQFEGVPDLYLRKTIKISIVEDNKPIIKEVQVYFQSEEEKEDLDNKFLIDTWEV